MKTQNLILTLLLAIPASAAPVVTGPAAAPGAAPTTFSYDELKTVYRATEPLTLTEIRNNGSILDGKVVEMMGAIKGVIGGANGRVCLLQSGPDLVKLTVPANLPSLASLRPTSSARLLVKVENQGSGPTLTLLAEAPPLDKPPPVKPAVTDNSDIIVVHPVEGAQLPEPPRPHPDRRRPRIAVVRGAQTVAPAAVEYENRTDDLIESQKPAYVALVRRFNNKLRPDQVDEIATALLSAGYANSMDPRFLAAIISVESDFDIYCLSSSGAMGLGQLMPFNVREAGITNPWSPSQNILATARLLRHHLNDYQNRPNGTLLAVAAYNAGPGAVRRAGYRVPDGQQVQRYVWKVYYRYKDFAPDMFKK